MTQFPNLLSPLKIGQCEVRNRILVSAHVPGFAENYLPGDKYIAYHRTYARSGVGLQITGGTPVHESGLLRTVAAPYSLINLILQAGLPRRFGRKPQAIFHTQCHSMKSKK